MIRGRKIDDDELVEISGGMDGLTRVEMDQTDSAGPGSVRREEPSPGGSPDLENSSDGTQDVSPGN